MPEIDLILYIATLGNMSHTYIVHIEVLFCMLACQEMLKNKFFSGQVISAWLSLKYIIAIIYNNNYFCTTLEYRRIKNITCKHLKSQKIKLNHIIIHGHCLFTPTIYAQVQK